jgi:hypothetical protein
MFNILLLQKNRFIFVAIYANPTQLQSVLGVYLVKINQKEILFF